MASITIDPESATQSVAEEAFTNEKVDSDAPSNAINKSFLSPQLSSTRLSSFSKLYDVDGDGKLDAAEMAMKSMDQSGRGYLTNDKVYELMLQQFETQKQLFRVKRIMFVLLALVGFLALANLGTSFAAASLAKNTTVSPSAALMDKKTNEVISTQTTADTLLIVRAIITEDGQRKLCNEGEEGCEEEKWKKSVLSMNETKCERMREECAAGKTVILRRPWKNGDTTDYPVCPGTGTISRSDRSELTNSHGLKFTFQPLMGGGCKVGGSALDQPVDSICEHRRDCSGRLSCAKNHTEIDECTARCYRLRWGASRREPALLACQHKICQAQDAVDA